MGSLAVERESRVSPLTGFRGDLGDWRRRKHEGSRGDEAPRGGTGEEEPSAGRVGLGSAVGTKFGHVA